MAIKILRLLFIVSEASVFQNDCTNQEVYQVDSGKALKDGRA